MQGNSNTDRADTATIRIHEPGDIVDAVPYLVGFHPTDSIVILGLRDSRIDVAARFDLADADVTPGVIERIATSANCDRIVSVVYGDRQAAEQLVAQLEDAADAAGVRILDQLVVAEGRWWSLSCAEPSHCPSEGTPIGTDSAVRASAIYAGLTAEPTRQDYLGRHRPLEDRDELLPAIRACEDAEVRAMIADRLPTHHRAVTRAVFRATRSDVPPDDDTAARLLVGLRSFAVRDAVWLAVDDATLDGCQLWLDLARRAPAPYDAAPWFLLAWASWRAGRSVLARDAVERALGSDPGYSAADLLLAAIEHHLDPRRMPMLRQPSK